MSTQTLNDTDAIKQKFQKLFEKSQDEQIEHRAHMLSFMFLSEVERAIDKKGWTKKRLADEIGTSASYLTQLFRGDRLLNLKTVAKMEQALGFQFNIEANSQLEDSTPYKKLSSEQIHVNEPSDDK